MLEARALCRTSNSEVVQIIQESMEFVAGKQGACTNTFEPKRTTLDKDEGELRGRVNQSSCYRRYVQETTHKQAY